MTILVRRSVSLSHPGHTLALEVAQDFPGGIVAERAGDAASSVMLFRGWMLKDLALKPLRQMPLVVSLPSILNFRLAEIY